MPAPSTFHSQEDYYHSLYHEMTHAAGHGSRLDREGITQQAKFGSERYSKEELIAELGAAFLSNEAGILDGVRFENSAAYLASWIGKLENDPRMIVSAASQAQWKSLPWPLRASFPLLSPARASSRFLCQSGGQAIRGRLHSGIDNHLCGSVKADCRWPCSKLNWVFSRPRCSQREGF